MRRRTDLESFKYRVAYSQTELCNTPDEIQLGPVREVIKMMRIDTPLDILYTADVPARLGLATSSALVIALLKAFYYLKKQAVAPEIIAEQAYRIERELLGESGGFQDQYIGWGGINFLQGKPHDVYREAVYFPPEKAKEFEKHMMLIYTGDQKSSPSVLQEQLQRLSSGETLDHTLRIKSLVQEMHAIMRGKVFNPLDLVYPMNEQWELKKKLSSKMSSPNITAIEERVREVCPHAGLRLVGSGGRGFILVLAPKETMRYLRSAVEPYKCSRFKIDWDGCRVTGTNKYLSV